jgi:hypothetical protein
MSYSIERRPDGSRKLAPKAGSMARSRFEVWSVDLKRKALRREEDARTFDGALERAKALGAESANELLIADRWQLLEQEVGDADLTPAEADAARVWRSWA